MQDNFDRRAKKRTVSLTLNSDLYTKAKAAGVNASKVAERALEQALAEQVAERARAEIRQDLDAYNKYVAEHGSPVAMSRAHYDDDAV